MKVILILCMSFLMACSTSAITITIPTDYSSIQAGINAASFGDVVLVLPGVYHEQLEMNGKTITFASNFLKSKDKKDIINTVIDGDSGTVIEIKNVGPETAIIGFTIQNGEDGIAGESKFKLLHNRITKCIDGVDYEKDSGGICRFNIFEQNSDDGIDLDENVDIVIEDNLIRDNEDDGIEIRLHHYNGPQLICIIRRNFISGNGEDGIQFIDYPDTSNRVFFVENNIITSTAMAAIGCMSNGNTKENYEAANIPERIYVINNTIIDNQYGISGGDNMAVINNIIMNTKQVALKQIDDKSIVAYNIFWGNFQDIIDCNTDEKTIIFKDPLLDQSYQLNPRSPAIDKGVAKYEWGGELIINKPRGIFLGKSLDIGALESGMGSWLEQWFQQGYLKDFLHISLWLQWYSVRTVPKLCPKYVRNIEIYANISKDI